MRSRAGKMQFITGYPVYQQPVGFDVKIAIAVPVSTQRMVLIPLGQYLAVEQQQ